MQKNPRLLSVLQVMMEWIDVFEIRGTRTLHLFGYLSFDFQLLPFCASTITILKSVQRHVHITELYNISGDCALIPRQSTNSNEKHGGFWPNLRHFDVTISLFSCRTPLTKYLSGKNLSMSRGQWMAP